MEQLQRVMNGEASESTQKIPDLKEGLLRGKIPRA